MKKNNIPFSTNKRLFLCLITLGVSLITLIVIAAVIDQQPIPAIQHNTKSSELKEGRFIGNIAPDFTLHTINGDEIKLSDYRGKNIILNFWATWCGPCRYEMPILQSCASECPEADFKIIAICTQDYPQNASIYAESNSLTFAIPLDTSGQAAKIYGISGLPTTFFIDREGVITFIKMGPFVDFAELHETIKSMK